MERAFKVEPPPTYVLLYHSTSYSLLYLVPLPVVHNPMEHESFLRAEDYASHGN